MKKKVVKISILTACFLVFIGLYSYIYHREYSFKFKEEEVKMITITSSYPYKTESLTSREDIEKYIKNINDMKFSHPRLGKKKEYSILVKIHYGSENKEEEYTFYLKGNRIITPYFTYDIKL